MTTPYRSPWMTEELEVFRVQFRRFLAKLGYPYVDESRNPAYRLFLG